MNKNYRRQIAMQRDWSWQNARARQKTQKSSSTIHPLWMGLFTLGIITMGVGIVVFQHTGQNASTGAHLRTPALSGQHMPTRIGSPDTQTPATPQVRTGVFTLDDAGPIPVPANVLKPVNIARTILNDEIYSIYAGSLARQPEVGVLAVLQENTLSGKQNMHIYQSPRHLGALTIQSLQQNVVIFTSADGSQGRFDLFADQFQSM